jgi:benzoate-CoA ligase family protein
LEEYNISSKLVDTPVEEGLGDKVVIYYRDRMYTRKELQNMVNRAGNALIGLGVRIEERVLISLYDSPEALAVFLGAIKIGAIPVMVNYMYTAEDYLHLLNDSRATTLIVDRDFFDTALAKRADFHFLKNTLVVGGKKGDNIYSFEELMEKASEKLEASHTTADDMAFWNYTSGSTGAPKAAVHLQHDIMCCVENYARDVLNIGEQDRLFSASKLFFAYGLGNSCYFPLALGASVVLLPDRPLPATVFETIQKYRPTVFFGVPTLYSSMLQVADAGKYDLSSLRCCVSAGEALPAEILRKWNEKFGLEIIDGLGSTELLHIFISNRPGNVKPGSSGNVLPGSEARLVDDSGNEVAEGETGTLWVKSDSAAAFYYRHHEKTKQAMLGAWFNTGDKYKRDSDGFYFYQGRADDMLKVGGIWVSPIEIEGAIFTHPAVSEAAVVGKADEAGLIKPKAYIVLKPGYEPSEQLKQELQAFVKKKLASYKFPRWIDFVPELPKTATGKVQRHKLKD